MKKTLSLLYIALFLLLCLLPSLGMLVFGESRAAANEILAAPPALQAPDGSFNSGVLNDTADYLADRFALRQELVTLWSRLHAALFGTSAEEQVLLGSEGWLYYSATLDDYAGQHLDEVSLQRIAENLAAIQSYIEERGARFFFTVAPNKNSLYPRHMPERFPAEHEQSNLCLLLPHLQAAGVNYVDLFSLFGETAVHYYAEDSHWTARGAAMAADRLLEAMGKDTDFSAGPFTEGELRKGDLYEMLYPAAQGGERELLYQGKFRHTHLTSSAHGNAMLLSTLCESAEGRLLCWRDSFGVALYPYLAESFASAQFLRAAVYDFSRYEPGDYDVVLIEIVERNLPQLAGECMILPSDGKKVDT